MSVRKAFLWAISGQLLAFVVTFGTTIVLSRLLTPHEIGIYAISIAIMSILQAVSSFGISAYIVSEQELDQVKLASAFTINAIVSVCLGICLFLASYVPVITFDNHLVVVTLRILAVAPILSILEFQPSVMLQREMRFDIISRITIGRTVVGSLVSITAAMLGSGALSSAYGNLTYASIGAALFPLAARSHRGFRLSLTQWRNVAAFGAKSLSIGGVSLIAMRLCEIILGHMLGLAALGLYTRANAISAIIFQNLYGSAARVFMAQMAEEERQGRGLHAVYLRGLEIVLALMWPTLLGIAVLAGPIVTFLFGPQWLAAAVPLAILMLVQAIGLSFAMSYELFVLRNEVGRQVPLEFIRSLVGVCAFTIGCLFGITGAAAGRLLDSITGAYLLLPHMQRLSGAEAGELTSVFRRSLALTIVAVLPSTVLMTMYQWSPAVPFGYVGVSILLSAILWFITLSYQRHPLYREALLLLDRIGLHPRRQENAADKE